VADSFLYDHGEFRVAIGYDDPSGLLADYPAMPGLVDAALTYLAQFVRFAGTVDIVIEVGGTATGRISGGPDDLVALDQTFDGRQLVQTALLAESLTGTDLHPDRTDLRIRIPADPMTLATLWFDPDIASGFNRNPPDHKVDLFSVLVHEVLHGMGVIGYRNVATGALTGDFATVYDSMVRIEGDSAWFGGAAVRELLGGEAALMLGGSQGIYHLGGGEDAHDSAQPWLEADSLNGYHFARGERYQIGRLDLAILADLGWQLKDTALTALTNPWDDRASGVTSIGWDRDETLAGTALADHIEGRGGSDTISGLAGDDVIDGGLGFDIVVFSGRLENYSVARSGNSLRVADRRGDDGVDTLTNVELLRFADGDYATGQSDGQTGATTGWTLFLRDGTPTSIGGSGTVIGNRAAQHLIVRDEAGTITLDPSFNRGGDLVELHGKAGDWKASTEGSLVRLSDGDTSVLMPLGVSATTVQFDDGARALRFDAIGQHAMLDSQVIGDTAQVIGSSLALDRAPLAPLAPMSPMAAMPPMASSPALVIDHVLTSAGMIA